MKASLLLILLSFLGTQPALAQSSDVDELNRRLERVAPEPQGLFFEERWVKAARALSESSLSLEDNCNEVRSESIGYSFAASFNDQGEACKIYDLSFMSLGTLKQAITVSELPVQSFKARDYLDWMDGHYNKVLGKVQTFQSGFKKLEKRDFARWVQRVEFDNQQLLSTTAIVPETGLPRSFKASDVVLGRRFEFSKEDREELKGVLAKFEDSSAQTLFSLRSPAWKALVEHPESLLNKVSFQWDDAKKVYEIILDGDFLPVAAPITLVDYQKPYKVAVERILRSVVQSAFNQLVRFVPASSQQLVGIAINEVFNSLDQAYEYELNRLEVILRAQAQMSGDASQLSANDQVSGLNILFGGRADVVTEYMMASAQGRPFGWDQFEEIGKRVRYQSEKSREVMLNNMFSKMTLDDGCAMALHHQYFGVCKKNEDGTGKTHHSMISENTVLFWSLGAPQIFVEDRPAQVVLMRSSAMLLSVGARMLNLPIISYFSGYLADALKSYATSGVVDEGLLSAELAMASEKGRLTETESTMKKYLYLQNLNGFLPKSESLEKKVIELNRRALEARLERGES